MNELIVLHYGHHPQVDVCYCNVAIVLRALIIFNRTTCYGHINQSPLKDCYLFIY